MKLLEDLSIQDLKNYPIWQFLNQDELGETAIEAVHKIPTDDLDGKVVGTEIQLANGDRLWGILSNINVRNKLKTQHFLTLSIFVEGQWVPLARYHDVDYTTHGPDFLAKTLNLNVDEIFPIGYDISSLSKGEKDCLVGVIPKEPASRMSRSDLIKLAVDSN